MGSADVLTRIVVAGALLYVTVMIVVSVKLYELSVKINLKNKEVAKAEKTLGDNLSAVHCSIAKVKCELMNAKGGEKIECENNCI